MNIHNFCITIISLVMLSVLGACQPTIHDQGKKVELEELSKLKEGLHTKNEVLQVLGSPSTVSSFGDNKWYYVYKQTSAVAFFKPDTLEQNIVSIEFDQNEVITKITILGENEAQSVDYVERITPTAGHSASFLNQVFGDFGRVAKKGDSKP